MGCGASSGQGSSVKPIAVLVKPSQIVPAATSEKVDPITAEKTVEYDADPSLAQIDMMMTQATGNHYDLLVIGGGPVGVKAAVEGASRGLRVGLIESKEIIYGAPTGAHSKCLREAVLSGVKTWAEVQTVLEESMASSHHMSARSLRTFQVKHLRGLGALIDERRVCFTPSAEAGGGQPQELTFGALILATGSRANRFPPVNFSLPGVFDTDTIQSIARIPRRVVVQGAGIAGLEYALIFQKLGSTVVVVEMFDLVVPMLDVSLQEACKETLLENGVQLFMKTPIKAVEAEPGSTTQEPRLRVDTGDRVFECDCLICATGRHGCSDGLGLEALEAHGLKRGRGKMIEVDENGHTGCGNIYAVGDVASGSFGLATMGMYQAFRAVRSLIPGSATFLAKEKRKEVKPSAVWMIPELAWAGMTEAKAQEDGYNVGTSKVLYNQTLRGCVTKENGFLNLVFDRTTGKVLGVHIFGEMASEIVNYGAEIINGGSTIFEMLQFVFPAVTYHLLYHHAATEAKLRLKCAQNLSAATRWKRINLTLKKRCEAGGSVEKTMAEAFKQMDEDNTGFLTPHGLLKAMQKLEIECSEKDIKDMILEATGGQREDALDYETFLKMLKSL